MAAGLVEAAVPRAQHMRALAQANRVRLARATLKGEVADGTRTVASVIAEVPWEAETMTIADLLMAQHRWGRQRVRRFLNTVPMVENKTIGSMTVRQRELLCRLLDGHGSDWAEFWQQNHA